MKQNKVQDKRNSRHKTKTRINQFQDTIEEPRQPIQPTRRKTKDNWQGQHQDKQEATKQSSLIFG
jgi:hypothetical protein